jgi:flagellar basal-body rod protein FlgG
MSSALEVAAVGMRAQQGALDAIANNISNINTPAFKRSELRFSELVDRRPVDGVAAQKNGLQTDTLAGVEWRARPLIEKQGQIEATGNTRDIAIAGRGFIELAGPGGRSLLWRGGSIRILEDGALATSSGYLLKAAITVPTNATEIRIERNGKVTALLPQPEGETEIGQINLVIAADTGRIERLEGGVFAVTDFGELIEAAPGDEGFGSLVQASLESSNVDLNAEMINLLISQRAYAANAQVVRAADELYGIANGLRR